MWLKGPKKPYPWSWENVSVHSHFAHAEGGRNWMTDSHVAHHSRIISLIPIWHHTEVLSSPVCQLHFCMHEYWYDIRGWKNVRRQLWLLCLCWFPWVCKVCKCMHVTSFWKNILKHTRMHACTLTHTHSISDIVRSYNLGPIFATDYKMTQSIESLFDPNSILILSTR